MEGYRRIVAGIIEREGQVLIGKKKDDPGHYLSNEWHIPGGKAFPEETDEQALTREMREETGLEVKIERFIDESFHEESRRWVRWYVCTPLTDKLDPKDDLVDAKFIPRKDVLSIYNQMGVSLMPPKVIEYFRS